MTDVFRYIVGFLISLVLTIASFALVLEYSSGALALSSSTVAAALIALAVAQLLVQAFFFLHLSEEEGPRWRLLSFLFALLVVAILVGGTLWIMQNLSHGQVLYREVYEDGVISPQAQHD